MCLLNCFLSFLHLEEKKVFILEEKKQKKGELKVKKKSNELIPENIVMKKWKKIFFFSLPFFSIFFFSSQIFVCKNIPNCWGKILNLFLTLLISLCHFSKTLPTMWIHIEKFCFRFFPSFFSFILSTNLH